jgi:transcriptional regulator with XRE-family HTH domain
VTLVKQLVKQRRRLGLTQTDLAVRLSLTQGTISQFESGDDPRLSTLLRYAKAVGMKVVAVSEDEVCAGED